MDDTEQSETPAWIRGIPVIVTLVASALIICVHFLARPSLEPWQPWLASVIQGAIAAVGLVTLLLYPDKRKWWEKAFFYAFAVIGVYVAMSAVIHFFMPHHPKNPEAHTSASLPNTEPNNDGL